MLHLYRSPHYRYYAETDTLSIYIAKAVTGLIDTTEVDYPGLRVDYTADESVVSLDISLATRTIHAHFWDTREDANSLPRLCLSSQYIPTRDQLRLSFNDRPTPASQIMTENPNIKIDVDVNGLWDAVIFECASATLAT